MSDALIRETLAAFPPTTAPAELPYPAEARAIRDGAAPNASIARLIDHTLLKPEATRAQIEALCDEALRYGFASVCVNPGWVPLAAERLAGSEVLVCTVIGFPLGATSTAAKVAETEIACAQGAAEVDMVLAIGRLRGGELTEAGEDIRAVAEAAHAGGALLKVIIETSLLDEAQKVRACTLSRAAGAEFVKTSTGFGGGGATVEDIALMRRTVGEGLGVKASGGVRGLADAVALIRAGATRIGASAGAQIVKEAEGGTWDASASSSGY